MDIIRMLAKKNQKIMIIKIKNKIRLFAIIVNKLVIIVINAKINYNQIFVFIANNKVILKKIVK